MANMDTLNFVNQQRYEDYFKAYRPGNAYFISFLNYRERQHEFERILVDSVDNILSMFIDYWKKNYEK